MNIVPWRKPQVEERESYPLPFLEWANLFNTSYQGVGYQISGTQTLTGGTESIPADFRGLIQGAYQANGIVFACMLTRMLHFVQARFQFQQIIGGRPGKLFGTAELGLLETPWRNGTTMDLLGRMIGDVDLAGNFYAVRQGSRLHRLRPDWTYIVLGSTSKRDSWEPGDPDTDVIGYQYHPGGLYSGRDPYLYLPEEIAHWAPIQDPLAEYRGMSWLTPILRDIQGDQSMTTHRQKFFDQGATVNHVVKIPAATIEAFDKWVDKLEQKHRGLANAYRTVYLGAGADMVAIGSDMQQVDFAQTQGAGEVRIAIAARVPATIIGVNEGLKGSTLNAGNYQSARRQFADELLRPMWAGAAGALASILAVPGGSRLWYDDRDIPFLKEDVKDAADVRQKDATTAMSLIQGGWEPDSIIQSIVADDLTLLLGNHTGLTSVQLQPPNTGSTMSSGTA
jgi:hypothetical protein